MSDDDDVYDEPTDAVDEEGLPIPPPTNAPPPPPPAAPPPVAPPAGPVDPNAAFAALALSSDRVANLIAQMTQSAALSDPFVAISMAEKTLIPSEQAEIAAIDASASLDPNRPFGFDTNCDIARNEWHRRRGRKIDAVKKSLPQDGYLNQAQDRTMWQSRGVVSSNLTEADIRKSEPEMEKFLDRKRWNSKFTARSNLRQFRNKVQSSFYDEIVVSADYASYLTGSNVRFFVLEHMMIALWRKAEAEDTVDPVGGKPWSHQIPFRPSESVLDPSTEVTRAVPAKIHERYVSLLDQYSRWSSAGIPAKELVPELFSPLLEAKDSKGKPMERKDMNITDAIVSRHPKDPAVQAFLANRKPMPCLIEPKPKNKNLGFYRVNDDMVRPVDPQFQRNAVLSETSDATGGLREVQAPIFDHWRADCQKCGIRLPSRSLRRTR